jgi:hypothetical protein
MPAITHGIRIHSAKKPVSHESFSEITASACFDGDAQKEGNFRTEGQEMWRGKLSGSHAGITDTPDLPGKVFLDGITGEIPEESIIKNQVIK